MKSPLGVINRKRAEYKVTKNRVFFSDLSIKALLCIVNTCIESKS